jgi:hypothetical protein
MVNWTIYETTSAMLAGRTYYRASIHGLQLRLQLLQFSLVRLVRPLILHLPHSGVFHVHLSVAEALPVHLLLQ